MKQAVKWEKPLVVHCRNNPKNNYAEDDGYMLMTKVLPKEWKVHLHCFTSDNATLPKKLFAVFPNLCVGFT